jgi:hypothetical protein
MEKDEEEVWWNNVWSARFAGIALVVFLPWSLLPLLVMVWLYGRDKTIEFLNALQAEALVIVGIIFSFVIILFYIGFSFYTQNSFSVFILTLLD